ncbi:MAG TPA: cell division protein FtsZ [bacterium]|nr:cell division protein FtsZ [bacterium]
MGSIVEIVPPGVSFPIRTLPLSVRQECPFVWFASDECDAPQTKVLVAGVGGDGCNTVEQMQSMAPSSLDFIAIDTDYMSLERLTIEWKLLLGKHTARSIGSGGNADLGRAAAEEASEEWADKIANYGMVIIVAGMGGGTGSGAAAYLAKMARDMGVLTVAVVSSPFEYEGRQKADSASEGIAKLRSSADSIIVIPNDRLFSLSDRLTYYEALKLRDDQLVRIIGSVTDLVLRPARMSIDFGSIRAVIEDGGMMVVAQASASGEGVVDELLEQLLHKNLIDHPPMDAAQAVLLVTTLGYKVTASEDTELKSRISRVVSPMAKVFCGTRLEKGAGDSVTVTLIATHFDELPEPQAEVIELERVFTIEQINSAGPSHRIYTPSYLRLKAPSESNG